MPVTVSDRIPAVVDEQEMVAVPEPVTVPVRTTVPEKLFRAETVIVEVALTPVLTVAGEVAEIEKSAVFAKVKVAVVE